MGYYNARGELVFASRKDYQIKHMGHRIELGEIEADVGYMDGVNACCCIFMEDSKKIVLFYVGGLDKATLTSKLKARLPRYMIPNAIMKLESLPLTPNGKMDRLKMKELYRSRKQTRHKK